MNFNTDSEINDDLEDDDYYPSLYEPTVVIQEESSFEIKDGWQVFIKEESLTSLENNLDTNPEDIQNFHGKLLTDVKEEQYKSASENNYHKVKSCNMGEGINSCNTTTAFTTYNIESSESLNMNYFNSLYLNSNMATHPTISKHETKLKCYVCDFETSKMEILIKHAIEHTYKNSKISQNSNSSNQMEQKSKSNISFPSKSKVFKCSQCSYETNRKFNLKTHCLNHSNAKMLSCTSCDYQTNDKSNLNSHLLIHASTKLFKCSKCNYGTNRKGSLKSHSLTHANKKMYNCTQCSYKCNHKSNLKIHQIKHSNMKSYKCSKCDYTCNLKGNLKAHKLTHTKKE